METQVQKTYKLLKKAGSNGVPNYKFPQNNLLRYSHYISELRKEGHRITIERQYLPNGRASNVYWYYLEKDDE